MMTHTDAVKSIDIESLLLVICRRLKVLESQASSPSENGCVILRPELIRDHDILKILLPAEVYSGAFSSELNTYFHTFVLRNRACLLTALLTYVELVNCGMSSSAMLLAERVREACAEDLEEIKGRLSETHSLDFSPGTGGFALPVLAVSALGIHLQQGASGRCRFFAAYESGLCGRSTRGVFCEEHKGEEWWLDSRCPSGSVHARMFSFYLESSNLGAFDGDTLRELVAGFWKRYARYARERDDSFWESDCARHALTLFGYEGKKELLGKGEPGLRKRFLELARLVHPDVGGSDDDFRDLHACYQTLREALP